MGFSVPMCKECDLMEFSDFVAQPVLWLRMGECCLGKYQQEHNKGLKSLASGGNGHIQGPVVVHVIGGER